MIELARGRATSQATPAKFYARWVAHESWTEWSPDTEWVRVNGPVRLGAEGVLKPRGGPRVKFAISALEPDREYTDTARFPGARLVFQHTADTLADGTALDVRVSVTGPLEWMWARILRKGFEGSVQADLDRLVVLVEQR